MLTILAIDDKQDNLLSLSALLKGTMPECHVITALSGHQGIEMAETESPDTILLDIHMPEMDGFETCKILKSNLGTKHIPVILLTAILTGLDSRVKGLEIGADAFLVKPVDQFELAAQVNAMLRIKKAEDLLRKESGQLEQQVRQRTSELVNKHEQLLFQMKEKQKSDDALWESEEKYRSMMEAIDDGIYICSSEHRIDYMNPAMMKMLGGDFTGSLCYAIVHGTKDKCVDCPHDKIKIGEPWEAKVAIRGNKSYNVSHTAVTHINGSISMLCILHDLTHVHKIEEEKANLLSQLTMADKMASIGQLAAGVAHEINNPVGFVNSNLNSLEGYLSNLKEMINMNNNLIVNLQATEMPTTISEIKEKIESYAKEVDADFILDDIDELLGDCKEGLNRIMNIVTDLKNFAHPGKEEPENVDINAGIESTLNVISNELKYKAKVTKDLGTLPLIQAVPQQLNQVFLNILVNAGHALEEMGEIIIKTWSENDTIYISISDNGCGISIENINKIFDPFFTTKEVGKGTGLGMNIAYNIIEKHQGNITINSKVGEGTTFTISLPIN